MANVSVKFRGREVENRFFRALIIVVTIITVIPMAIIGVIIGMFVIFPLALILHPIFALSGRRGTIRQENNKLTIAIDREAFRKEGNG